MTRRWIIAIHGVGDGREGETLLALPEVGADYSRRDLVIGGRQYARLEAAGTQSPRLIEVSWYDFMRPHRSWFGLWMHGLRLLFATLHVGEHWPATGAISLWLIRLYRVTFESFLIWTLPFVLYVMCLANLRAFGWWAALTAGVLLPLGFAYLCWSWSAALRWGSVAAAVAFISVPVLLLVFDATELWDHLTGLSTRSYILSQFIASAFLTVLGVWLLCDRHSGRIMQRLTRLALLYGPFIAFTIVGSVLWSLCLMIVRPDDAQSAATSSHALSWELWRQRHVTTIPYDLTLVERTMTIAVALIGIFCLVGAAAYVICRKLGLRDRFAAGRVAQGAVASVLVVSPVLLGVVAAVMWWSSIQWSMKGVKNEPAALDVYEVSAARLLPFLPLLVGPLSVMADVIGDVLFYLAPANFNFSAKEQLRRRLHAVIQQLPEADQILLLSHSQGTVIAADYLAQRNSHANITFFTMGSPIESLYHRFLRYPLPLDLGAAGWMNFYRLGDYIGGPIGHHDCVNVELSTGGHLGYWRDSTILKSVREWALATGAASAV